MPEPGLDELFVAAMLTELRAEMSAQRISGAELHRRLLRAAGPPIVSYDGLQNYLKGDREFPFPLLSRIVRELRTDYATLEQRALDRLRADSARRTAGDRDAGQSR